MPVWLSNDDPGRACRASFNSMADIAMSYQFEEQVGNCWSCASPSAWSAGITPWNYPLHQIAAEGRPGPGRRLHRRAQAQRGGAAQRLHPGRDHRRGRPAGRRVQPGHRRRPGGRRGHRRPPRRRHGVVHRLHPRRQARGRSRPRRRSRRSPSSSAASAPTSSSTTPTSPRPSPTASGKCFLNSGQTCTALTRMLVPRSQAGRGRGRSPRPPRPRRSPPGNPFDDGQPARPARVGRPARPRARLHPDRASTRAPRCVTGGAERARGARHGLLRAADRLHRRHAAT